MKSIREALRESITTHNLPELAQAVDHGRSLGMNYYDLLTEAEHAVPNLGEDEWGELVSEISGWES